MKLINGYKIAAVCTARIHEKYVFNFIQSFNNVLAENGWRVFVYTVDSDLFYNTRSDKGEAAVFGLIDYSMTDALLLFPNNIHSDTVIEDIAVKCEQNGVRLLMIDRKREGAINVMFDYHGGFKKIVRHVLDVHGVRKIHMIAGVKGMDISEMRTDAVRELAAEYGIPFGDDDISYGDFWSVPTEKACEKLIAENRLPDALFCANDMTAITACSVLRKHGINVPEDIIVTGFDGIEESEYTYPKITTAGCDFGKLGEAAAEAVMDKDAGGRDIYVMPDPIIAGSCGCQKNSAVDASEIVTYYQNAFNRYLNEERKLARIGSKVQVCGDLDELEDKLRDSVFYNMTCVLKKEVTDPTFDPLVINTPTLFGKDMVVLFDADESYKDKPREIALSSVIPRLDEIFELKVPLIFISLHFIDIPLGYACFYFNNAVIQDYNKIGQTSRTISAAIGGYRNLRYQYRLREWIEEIYKYDELTGLFTRNSFRREYDKLVESGPEEMTMVLCDLNGLKIINDNYSHSEGDNAIKKVAEALKAACPGGICSKHGGDELVAAIPEKRDMDEIRNSINKYLDDYNKVSGKPYKVSASIGICCSENGNLDFSALFAKADELMYEEKVKSKMLRE